MSADLPSPSMDWTNPDRSTSLKEFKQMCELWFAIRDVKPENQKNYMCTSTILVHLAKMHSRDGKTTTKHC